MKITLLNDRILTLPYATWRLVLAPTANHSYWVYLLFKLVISSGCWHITFDWWSQH